MRCPLADAETAFISCHVDGFLCWFRAIRAPQTCRHWRRHFEEGLGA